MTARFVVFTQQSLERMHQFSIDDQWFSEFSLPEGAIGLRRVSLNNIVFIFEDSREDDNTPIVIFNNTGEFAVFRDALNPSATLDRAMTVSSSLLSSSVRIPTTWRPYHEGNKLSVYAGNRESSYGARLNFARNLGPEGDIFAFAKTAETINFSELTVDYKAYRDVRDNFTDALLSQNDSAVCGTSAGIVLCQRLPHGFVQNASLDDWYTSKLTSEQREFVDKPYDGPVRLRGSAGTGKTVSLVIKMLKDAYFFEESRRPKRFCFLTHSTASVDLVDAIAFALDRKGIVTGEGEYVSVEIRTLYDLAHEHLDFELRQLQPLSLDGREGRQLQYELIQTVLREMNESRVMRSRFQGLSDMYRARWHDAAYGKDPSFVAEVMNEFACVLDAENIRWGDETGEKYVKVMRRPNWLLDLPLEVDRRFMLEIHRRYRESLGQMKTLSIDQMVSDFNSFLNSNIWDRVREERGYDALFVDELHLFTVIEQQILHKLVKRIFEDERPARPAIFMAYDVKQSIRDSFVDYFEPKGGLFTARTNLQNSALVELHKVFRYTPEITEFLRDVDSAFPTLDIPGEWGAYVGDPQLERADVPVLRVYPNELTLIRRVFDDANKAAKRSVGGGRRVAVLCVSEALFDRYMGPAKGQFEGKVYTILDREGSSDLRHAGKRFIFSMPEYVAGLQFETVFLINVDVQEAPFGAGIRERRQLISNVYLGASRAEKHLFICACENRGGPSDILDMALKRGSILEKEI